MTTADVLPIAEPTVTLPTRVWPGRLAGYSRRGVVVGWLLLAAAVIFVSQLCNTMWAFGNAAPHHWDNADYLNLAYTDQWAAAFGGPTPPHPTGWRGVWDSILNADPARPPGYRIASLPFVFLGTKMLPTLRAASLLVFWATLVVMYRTAAIALPGRAGVAAGAIAAVLASTYLEVGWSVRVYGTEYTLYFAVAAMLWCFARALRPDRPPGWTWLWLGLSLGIGILSKMSFLFLAGPVGLLVLVLSITGRLPGLPLGRLYAAAGIGAVMAFPWYRYHLVAAYRYGSDMTQFSRHSLHKHGLDLIGAWLTLHAREGMGERAGGILVGLAAVGLTVPFVRWWRRVEGGVIGGARALDFSPVGWVTILGLVQGVPLLAFQLLFSSSDNTRHMTPAYLPLTVAAAVAAGSTGVLAAWWSWPVLLAVAVPAVQQVGQLFVPLTTTADDVWDWTPLYDLCQARGLRFPQLGRVGNFGQFNEPSMQAPWFARGDRAYGKWLWRGEDGPFDWPTVRALMDGVPTAAVPEPGPPRTVVVTTLDFHVPADHSMLADPLQQDNAHNAEFADHMAHEPGWLPAETFDIGVVNKATVFVFVRKRS